MSSQEQPEDSPPDDQTEPAAPDTESAGADAADVEADGETQETTEDERIERLTEHIDKVRSKAEEAGVLPDTDDEEEFADSGAIAEEDDQTIAPPG